jgi:hypothetical protein
MRPKKKELLFITGRREGQTLCFPAGLELKPALRPVFKIHYHRNHPKTNNPAYSQSHGNSFLNHIIRYRRRTGNQTRDYSGNKDKQNPCAKKYSKIFPYDNSLKN